MKTNDHVTLLGISFIALSACSLLVAAIVFTAVVGGGLLSGDDTAIFYTSRVGAALASLLTMLSLPGFVAAFGLLRRRTWGRIVGLVLGAMNLLNIPFGTALGIYSFWVLTRPDAEELFH